MNDITVPARLPTTRTFLDRLARRIAENEGLRSPVSDYRVSQVLGITNSAISYWRRHRGGMSDEIALKVAALIGEDERYMLACLQVERNRRNTVVREAWKRIATPGVIVSLALVFLLFLSPEAARAGEILSSVNTIHYAQRRRRKPRFLLVPAH